MLRIIALSLLATIAVLGCAKKDPLLGSWTTSWMVGTNKMDTTYTFNQDRTYKSEQKMQLMGQDLSSVKSGTYSWDKEKLVLTVKSFDITSQMPDAVKQQIMKSWNQKAKKPRTVSLTWDGDDKVNAIMEGESGAASNQTWVRKK